MNVEMVFTGTASIPVWSANGTLTFTPAGCAPTSGWLVTRPEWASVGYECNRLITPIMMGDEHELYAHDVSPH